MNRNSDFFRGLTSCGKRGGKALYKDKDGDYVQWDSLHGEWEKYNKHGRHIGVLKADGLDSGKDAVKGRRITI